MKCLVRFFITQEDSDARLQVSLETFILRCQAVYLTSKDPHLFDAWLRLAHDLEWCVMWDLGQWQSVLDDGRHCCFSPETLVQLVMM